MVTSSVDIKMTHFSKIQPPKPLFLGQFWPVVVHGAFRRDVTDQENPRMIFSTFVAQLSRLSLFPTSHDVISCL